MAISQANWNAIWNEGFDTGWDDRYRRADPIRRAPSAAALGISQADWNAVYNAGFQKAYGVTISAPGPGEIPSSFDPVATPAQVTTSGCGLDGDQWAQANILLGVCVHERAPNLAKLAIICAALGESGLRAIPTPNRYGYWGVLQGGSGERGSAANFPPPNGWNDSAGMAWHFLHGGLGFQGGGALAQINQGNGDPGCIATVVEASGETCGYYGANIAQAECIVGAFGGQPVSYTPGRGVSSGPAVPTAQVLINAIEADEWSSWYVYGIAAMYARAYNGYLRSEKAYNDSRSVDTFTETGGR